MIFNLEHLVKIYKYRAKRIIDSDKMAILFVRTSPKDGTDKFLQQNKLEGKNLYLDKVVF